LKLQEKDFEEKVKKLEQNVRVLETGNYDKTQQVLRDQRKIIEKYKDELQLAQKSLQDEKEKQVHQEQGIADLQRDLLTMRGRLAQYEKGYGLEEAIKEIRDEKGKVKERDKEIKALIQQLHERLALFFQVEKQGVSG
jgi:hypothetical protein